MRSRVPNLIADLKPVRRPARILYRGAAFWLASAVFHIGALGLDGWEWSGAVSFRKPIVFSLSIGLLLATVGWVLDRLPDRPRLAGGLAWTLLVSSSIEVGLIAVQAWRGRASHFNVFQPGDAAIFALMGLAVGVMSLCLIAVLVWSAVRRPADRLVAGAVIWGMALVATGLGIGQWIIELGNDFVAQSGVLPETVISGEAGVAKFPHAIAFHGIQVFIVSALMLRRSGVTEAVRARLIRAVILSYSAILALASAQAVLGVAPSAPGVWSLGMLIAGTVLALTLWRIVSAYRHSPADREVPVAVA